MLHSPLFYVWIGWVLVIGVFVALRGAYVLWEHAERQRQYAARASWRIGRTPHPIRPPQHAPLPPGYRQHLIDAGIIKPAGDPT